MRLVYLFLFLILLTGCAETIPAKYTVYISSDFTPHQVNQIEEGVLKWKKLIITHPPEFQFRVQGASNHSPPRYNTIYIFPGFPFDDELGWTTWYSPNNVAWIKLNDMPEDWFLKVVIHETGHALGLDHMNRFSIMNPYVDKMSNYITKEDIDLLCNEHPSWCFLQSHTIRQPQ
jgi:hypothetical protein